MKRRRVYLPPERIAGGRAQLTSEAHHYLRDVLRLPIGAEIEIFDGAGGVYRAVFDDAQSLIVDNGHREQPPGIAVWLAFGLSKGEKPDLVIQKATELGAARLLPWQASRSVVRLEGERAAERVERWRRIAVAAARQCGRAEVPEVVRPGALAEILETVPSSFIRMVFDTSGEPLGPWQSDGILAVIGPEGGLTREELDACAAAGCRLVSLGPRVLRTETAAIAAVALLQYLGGDVDPAPGKK